MCIRDRIDILHVTYGDAVSVRITHYFVLDFLPSCDTALNQYLTEMCIRDRSYTGSNEWTMCSYSMEFSF